uniref:Uncharacterized protein n=1 Tax=Aplanochytrium stocchinoi TaxID=215587 RepID=A0A7S3PIG4_9STRA|mmetsp:Transcript_7823/g.9924  ORF Transcript_7823/g.9924 Transcript_7823/m.9924 type:complete len:157 (-) Transcript_7823:237-707(-)
MLGDPRNKLVKYFKKSRLLDVIITGPEGDEGYTNALYTKYAKFRGNMHGLAQPGVLVISSDLKIMFKWRIDPSIMNVGGAYDRPKIEEIWSAMKLKLKGDIPFESLVSPEDLQLHYLRIWDVVGLLPVFMKEHKFGVLLVGFLFLAYISSRVLGGT